MKTSHLCESSGRGVQPRASAQLHPPHPRPVHLQGNRDRAHRPRLTRRRDHRRNLGRVQLHPPRVECRRRVCQRPLLRARPLQPAGGLPLRPQLKPRVGDAQSPAREDRFEFRLPLAPVVRSVLRHRQPHRAAQRAVRGCRRLSISQRHLGRFAALQRRRAG